MQQKLATAVLDLPRAVAFWTAALGLVASDEWQSDDWRTLHYADGCGRALGLQRSESPVDAYPRVHLDLFVDTVAEQEAEVERLVGLGARSVFDERDGGTFFGFSDPDGNTWAVQQLKARAVKPLIPIEHRARFADDLPV